MSFDVVRWATEEYFTDGGGGRPAGIRETGRLCGKSQGWRGVGRYSGLRLILVILEAPRA